MATACHLCEGSGEVPVFCAANISFPAEEYCVADEPDPKLMALWKKAEQQKHAEDGWQFVKCPRCK